MTARQLDLFGGEEDPAPGTGASGQAPPCGLDRPGAFDPCLLVGACAWNHPSFQRHFYPPGLARARWLTYYAQYCNAIEVDSTFYRSPAVSTVEKWTAQTPGYFRFAVKAPKALTHEARLDLRDTFAHGEWHRLLDACAAFDGKLSCILLQLAPSLTVAGFDNLRRVLDTVPGGMPVAVEFRHPSWYLEKVHDDLAARGVVRAWADHYLDPDRGVGDGNPFYWADTGPFAYVRLLGDMSTKYRADGGKNFEYGSVLFDRGADLEAWTARVAGGMGRGQPFQIFINNHYEGFSLITAQKLRDGVARCLQRAGETPPRSNGP